MKLYIFIASLLHLSVSEDSEDTYKYVPIIDATVSGRVLSATNIKQQRKLGGVYGLCADNVNIPLFGGLVCDPPNRLPQICTLVCRKGYYSSGQHRDIACADAMCEGQCNSQKYDCIGNEIKFGSRPCTYTRYVSCDAVESGLCLEDVTEECKYSYYEEVRRPCCNITQLNPPDECWTSGCTGSCDSPGVFHYYSSSCGDVCPPWRDPDMPQFMCSACNLLALSINSEIIVSNAEGFDPPSEITVGCSPGFWGESVTSYCMSTDGTFYPPVNTIECTQCSSPPSFEGDMFTTVQINPGRFEFRCNSGFIGDSTFTECNRNTGIWNTPEPPYCDIAPSVAAEPSPLETPSITPSASPTPIFEEFPTPSVSPSETPSETPTRTPSASKSPRPPKVKGSRAPTQPPKLRVSPNRTF
jgi:hypothetical protein